jgi:hypothetical protein
MFGNKLLSKWQPMVAQILARPAAGHAARTEQNGRAFGIIGIQFKRSLSKTDLLSLATLSLL